MRARGGAVAGLALVAAAVAMQVPVAAGKDEAASARNATDGRLAATIRRTAYGVPHITASDWDDLAFGYGYAFAEDNVCTIADTYVTVRAERSRYFGPDASWQFRGNGSVVNNLNSDFFYQRVNDSGVIEKLLSQDPPHGPLPQIREGVRGYVAGYNEYLREAGGAEGIDDPRCKGEPWVRPITELDAYRRFYQLASLASQGVAIDGIGGAQPLIGAPGSASASSRGRWRERGREAMLAELRNRLPTGPNGTLGSNAYGLGSELTENGRGMVLGNPHFPWYGAERLYQSHLTIPGKADVQGASLYGVPLILIGNTRGLAWSHTVATAFRFTPYEVTLAPGDPTSYVVDGQVRKMEAQRVTVKVRNPDGSLGDRSRTLYRTEHGPMITEILGLPLFPWTPLRAYAMGDVNELNFRYVNHFFENNMAQSVREYDAIQRRYQGIPWVNSVAADSSGEAYYSMNGAIPNVPDSKVSSCPSVLGAASFQLLGLPTLDGSRSSCRWGADPDSVAPGIFGSSKTPSLFRRDFVTNGNDSHWLTNPKQPLEGFARIIGDERTARTLRTRVGLLMLMEEERTGRKFTLPHFQDTVLNNRQYTGELWRDELVRLCRSARTMPGSGGPVDVSAACPVLERWDLRDELDSRGSILFRRFAGHALGGLGLPVDAPLPLTSPFAEPFDVDDPVNTPRGLASSSPIVRRALADAVTDLREAGIPLDARLGDHQFSSRGGERIPIHGGPGGLGVFNAIGATWRPGEGGYSDVPHGSSYIMAMQFTGGRCPAEVRTFVTYGQSENRRSPHFNDYTRAFSEKRWNAVPFCADEVRRGTRERYKVVAGAGRKSKLRVSVTPRRVRAGRRTRFRVRVKALRDGRRVGVRGARVRLAGRSVRTGRGGRAAIRHTPRRSLTATACLRPYDCGRTRIRTLRPRRAR